MLQPLRNNASRRRTGQLKPVKAPYGGWNARDDYTDIAGLAVTDGNIIVGDGTACSRCSSLSERHGVIDDATHFKRGASIMICQTFQVTGEWYNVLGPAVVYTNTGGASYLPGNSSGGVASGGQYL